MGLLTNFIDMQELSISNQTILQERSLKFTRPRTLSGLCDEVLWQGLVCLRDMIQGRIQWKAIS